MVYLRRRVRPWVPRREPRLPEWARSVHAFAFADKVAASDQVARRYMHLWRKRASAPAHVHAGAQIVLASRMAPPLTFNHTRTIR